MRARFRVRGKEIPLSQCKTTEVSEEQNKHGGACVHVCVRVKVK